MTPTRRVSTVSVAALALLFAPSCAQLGVQRPDVEAGLNLTPIKSGQIVVWISSQARNYSPIVASSFAIDFPGARLIQREIPPEDFVRRVESKLPDDPAPDVAFIDNYRQLEPLLKTKVVLSAWGKSRFPTRGWWVIFKDTKRLTRAQAFVRWLNRAPDWQPQVRN